MVAFRERFFPEHHIRQPVQERVALAVSAPPRPSGITATPDRPAPPPPSVQDQAIKKLLEDALGDSGNVFEEPKRAKNRKLRVLMSRGIMAGLVIGAGVWGINKVRGDNEPTPQTSSADFPNRFNNDGSSVPEL